MNELFWNVAEEDRREGNTLVGNHYHCLMCDHTTEVGIIYRDGEAYYDAKKQMANHIQIEHGSVFEYMIQLSKKETGLSEHQSQLLGLFYQDKSDYEIQKMMNIGSISTVRNHRFALKEKEKQAKILITLLSLLKEQPKNQSAVKPHKTATMVDDRYNISEDEVKLTIGKYFPQGEEGPLKSFSMKEKNKIIVLKVILKHFEGGRHYSEGEVDDVLKAVYPQDHAVIRRYLIQYGFMDREKDCSDYWVKEEAHMAKSDSSKKISDARKKELKEKFKVEVTNESTESGVYQLTNIVNGKIYIGSERHIHQLNGIIFQLNIGSHLNTELQKDWTTYGENQFQFKVLESFKEEDYKGSISKKLKAMEKEWVVKQEAYGNKGYNKKPE